MRHLLIYYIITMNNVKIKFQEMEENNKVN